MSSRIFTVLVGGLILLVILAYLFSFEVRQTEMGLVLTFGQVGDRYIDGETDAGLYAQWPWPIQSVVKYDKRLNTFETLLEETLTADRHNVTISMAVGWQIKDPIRFRQSIGRRFDLAAVQRSIGDLVASEAAIIAQHRLENLVSTEPDKLKFDTIEQQMAEAVTHKAMAQFGVEVPLVRIRRLELPQDGAMAVYSRMKEERGREAMKYRAEGRGAASAIRARADSIKQQILSRAQAEAKEIRAQGDRQAAPYYEVFGGANEDLALFLRRVAAIKEVLAKNSTVILDQDTEPLTLFQGGMAGEPTGAPAAPAETSSVSPAGAAGRP